MPYWLVELYAEELPRLQAQEKIALTQVIGVGSGSMDKGHRRELVVEWNRRSQNIGGPRRARAANMSDLAAIGIGVK